MEPVQGCGVFIFKDNCILLGRRVDGQGFSIPGGKVDPGETHLEAVIREAKEEVHVKLHAEHMLYMGELDSEAIVYGEMRNVKSHIYICDKCDNIPTTSAELLTPRYYTKDEINEMIKLGWLFKPTQDGYARYILPNWEDK